MLVTACAHNVDCEGTFRKLTRTLSNFFRVLVSSSSSPEVRLPLQRLYAIRHVFRHIEQQIREFRSNVYLLSRLSLLNPGSVIDRDSESL